IKKDPEELMRVFSRFTSELQGLIESTSEKQFFSNYVNNCLLHTDPWGTPALIPQVWVNWIHYDSRDRNRAKRTQREPFRVDFVIKDQEISEDLAVIEIDGQSHFCEYRIDPVGNPTPYASMDSFVQHIQKDRWLRKQGWQVFRIT